MGKRQSDIERDLESDKLQTLQKERERKRQFKDEESGKMGKEMKEGDNIK